MINSKTVFILGAGASIPYGFMSGHDLRKSICKNYLLELSHIDYFQGITNEYRSKIKKFCSDFFYSSTESIDLFLSRNKDYEQMGKEAISFFIQKAEQYSQFNEDISIKDWYFLLYNKMTEDIIDGSAYKKFNENEIAFITFNYDRSLEYYLNTSLYHSYSDLRTKNFSYDFITLPIYHVYGSLGELTKVPYTKNNKTSWNDIINFSNNIKTIYDERSYIPDNILNLIQESKRVIFLGFAYNERNLDILRFNEWKANKEMFGTTLGLSAEMNNTLIKKFLSKQNEVTLKAVDSFELLNGIL